MERPDDDRLDSWKEIAAYLRRSVRTVRRWESEEGLPVHRHMHHRLGSVYAFRSEIDAWRRSGSRVPEPKPLPPPAAAVRSVVVLPFTNLSPDRENEYFADGLTEEVIADLSKVRRLRVISSTSSMTLKGTKKDVRTIGRELGVQYVLEGSVRRAGAQLRVSARLIDAANDDRVWAGKYDGTVDDVFAIQETLARTIVGALELRLTAEEEQRLAARPLGDIHAWECYLQARQEAFRWRRDSIDRAVQLLQNGLKIVGDNAHLYAALGRAHLQYRESGIDLTTRPLEQAEVCARKVLELEERSGAGAHLRGWIHYAKGEIQQAVRELKTALESGSGTADVLSLLSNCYLISGRVTHARPLIQRLLELDPLTPVSRCMPGWADLLEGDFAAAVGPYEQMFEMDPGNPMGRLFYVWVLALNDEREKAVAVARAFPPQLRDSVPARIAAFLASALSGSVDTSSISTPAVEAVATSTDVFPRLLAHGYAWAGMPGPAIDWLEVAVDRGFINHPFLAHHDPAFRSMRNDARFAAILERARDRWERFEP